MTLDAVNENDICTVCGWEDDWWDSNHPNEMPTCNPFTLNDARKLYQKYRRNIVAIRKEMDAREERYIAGMTEK